MRRLQVSLLAMIAAAIAPIATAQLPSPKTTDLGSGIHVIFGQGGNIGVSTGADGAFEMRGTPVDREFKQNPSTSTV